MDFFNTVFDWIDKNKEWFFSGAFFSTLAIIIGVVAFLLKLKKKPEIPSPPIEKEDNSQTTSQSTVITGDNNTSTQISNSPGSKVINNDKDR